MTNNNENKMPNNTEMSNINQNKLIKLFENCDMKKKVSNAKKLINSYMCTFEDGVNNIKWDKALPKSKVLFEYNKNNICYHGIECELFIKTLLMWGKYLVIFEYSNFGHDFDIHDIEWNELHDIKRNFEFIEFNSYSDELFMEPIIRKNISISHICNYFINTNRDINDVMKYIKMRCEFIITGGID
jgi:hypothetical protein